MKQPSLKLARMYFSEYNESIGFDKFSSFPRLINLRHKHNFKNADCIHFQNYVCGLAELLYLKIRTNFGCVGEIHELINIGSYLTFKSDCDYIIKYPYYNRTEKLVNKQLVCERIICEVSILNSVWNHISTIDGIELNIFPEYLYSGKVLGFSFFVYKLIDADRMDAEFLDEVVYKDNNFIRQLGRAMSGINTTPLSTVDNLYTRKLSYSKLHIAGDVKLVLQKIFNRWHNPTKEFFVNKNKNHMPIIKFIKQYRDNYPFLNNRIWLLLDELSEYMSIIMRECFGIKDSIFQHNNAISHNVDLVNMKNSINYNLHSKDCILTSGQEIVGIVDWEGSKPRLGGDFHTLEFVYKNIFLNNFTDKWSDSKKLDCSYWNTFIDSYSNLNKISWIESDYIRLRVTSEITFDVICNFKKLVGKSKPGTIPHNRVLGRIEFYLEMLQSYINITLPKWFK